MLSSKEREMVCPSALSDGMGDAIRFGAVVSLKRVEELLTICVKESTKLSELSLS